MARWVIAAVVLLGGLVMVGPALYWVKGGRQSRQAFAHQVSAPESLAYSIERELSESYWGDFARAAARRPVVTFEGTAERRRQPGSFTIGAHFEVGSVIVTISARAEGRELARVTGVGPTPETMMVYKGEDATASAWRQAERAALERIMPQVCAMLLTQSGERPEAMMAWVEKAWPKPQAMAALRGLGSAGAPYVDRLESHITSVGPQSHDMDNLILVLLAIDEKRGAAALARWRLEYGERERAIVLNQHLRLQPAVNDPDNLRPSGDATLVPWARPLSPGNARAILDFAGRYPQLTHVCVETLRLYDENDPEAAAALRRLGSP